MGSLTSGPSLPTTASPQIVYVPQTLNTVAAPVSTPDPVTVEEQAEETGTQVRKQNLLGRERSRFGTIQTSFRGLLGLGNQSASQPRKTLLGE